MLGKLGKEEKKSQIIEKLSLRKGNDIKISCVNNPEAVKFAKELMNIFKIAGWKVNPKYEVQFGQRQVSNVAVVIKSEEYMTLGKYIVSTFNNIIQFNDPPILQNSNRNKETIFLVIGTKKASPL